MIKPVNILTKNEYKRINYRNCLQDLHNQYRLKIICSKRDNKKLNPITLKDNYNCHKRRSKLNKNFWMIKEITPWDSIWIILSWLIPFQANICQIFNTKVHKDLSIEIEHSIDPITIIIPLIQIIQISIWILPIFIDGTNITGFRSFRIFILLKIIDIISNWGSDNLVI